MSNNDALDLESDFDPTQIETNLVGAKELRMWHWGLAMYFRRFYNMCENNPLYPDREQSLIHFDKMTSFHIKACQILNDILPADTTGESDLVQYVANKHGKSIRLH